MQTTMLGLKHFRQPHWYHFYLSSGAWKSPSGHRKKHAEVYATEASDSTAAHAASSATAPGRAGVETKTLDGIGKVP